MRSFVLPLKLTSMIQVGIFCASVKERHAGHREGPFVLVGLSIGIWDALPAMFNDMENVSAISNVSFQDVHITLL